MKAADNNIMRTLSEIPHFKVIHTTRQTTSYALQNVDGELVQIWVGRFGSGCYHQSTLVTFEDLQRINFAKADYPWE